jgi:hypothetical protein
MMSPGNSDARPFKALFRPGPKGIMDPIPTVPGNQSRYITLLAYSLITNYPQRFKSVQDVLDYLIKKHIIKIGEKPIRSIEKAVRKRNAEDMYGSSVNATFDTTPLGYRMKTGENRMYITKKALKQIIQEEVSGLNETDKTEVRVKPTDLSMALSRTDSSKKAAGILAQLMKVNPAIKAVFADATYRGKLVALAKLAGEEFEKAAGAFSTSVAVQMGKAVQVKEVSEDDEGTDEIAPLPSP